MIFTLTSLEEKFWSYNQTPRWSGIGSASAPSSSPENLTQKYWIISSENFPLILINTYMADFHICVWFYNTYSMKRFFKKHELLVSGSAWKECESVHSVLTTGKKLNKPKNKQLMLRSTSEVRTQGKPLLSKLKRQANTENHTLPNEKRAWDTALEQENWNCDWRISRGSVWTTVID